MAQLQQQSAIVAEIEKYEGLIGSNVEERVVFIIKATAIANPMKFEDRYPVEMSIAALSIDSGVLGCFSRLINPGALPAGCSFNAKQTCEDNGLPLPSLDFTEKHQAAIELMIEQVATFINKHMGSLPTSSTNPKYPTLCLFAMPKDIMDARSCLDWLLDKSERKNSTEWQLLKTCKVFDLAKLFFCMGRNIKLKVASYNPNWLRFNIVRLAETYLNTTRYNYNTEITCSYHKVKAEDKVEVCTKNHVLRRAFLILDDVVQILGTDMTKFHQITKYQLVHPEEFNPAPPPGASASDSAHSSLSKSHLFSSTETSSSP